jgi:hypothetical protein
MRAYNTCTQTYLHMHVYPAHIYTHARVPRTWRRAWALPSGISNAWVPAGILGVSTSPSASFSSWSVEVRARAHTHTHTHTHTHQHNQTHTPTHSWHSSARAHASVCVSLCADSVFPIPPRGLKRATKTPGFTSRTGSCRLSVPTSMTCDAISYGWSGE